MLIGISFYKSFCFFWKDALSVVCVCLRFLDYLCLSTLWFDTLNLEEGQTFVDLLLSFGVTCSDKCFELFRANIDSVNSKVGFNNSPSGDQEVREEDILQKDPNVINRYSIGGI